MEPVTYLAGLSTIMIGYLWFLYHNREVSYRSALNLTVSKRQNTLYEQKGFDVQKWENLIEEANALRKEIKSVADEYDVSNSLTFLSINLSWLYLLSTMASKSKSKQY